jgi:hypothetical protein
MSEQNLYIKVSEEGVPETHPILEDNLKNLIVNFDPLHPPKNIFKFIKTPIPELQEDQVYDYMDYEYSPELSEQYGQTVWHEVHHVKKIEDTDREKIISEFKKINPELSDWVYDEESKSLVPPVPKPNDGKMYFWNTDEKRWMESNSEMSYEDMIAVAKELGYDLAYGEHGRPPDISETLIDEIIGQIKKQQ